MIEAASKYCSVIDYFTLFILLSFSYVYCVCNLIEKKREKMV